MKISMAKQEAEAWPAQIRGQFAASGVIAIGAGV
jgi:hypothetical protein